MVIKIEFTPFPVCKIVPFKKGFKKSERKVRFRQLFFENDPLDEPKEMPSGEKFHLFGENGQKRKMVVKIEFTPLIFLTAKYFPFIKGFKNAHLHKTMIIK